MYRGDSQSGSKVKRFEEHSIYYSPALPALSQNFEPGQVSSFPI